MRPITHYVSRITILLLILFGLTVVAEGAPEWQVTIWVESGEGKNHLILGADDTATDGLDNQWDCYTILGGKLRPYFPRPDWDPYFKVFYRDIRAKAPGNTTEWPFVIESDMSNKNVKLTWDLSMLPQDYDISLIDDTNGQTIDIRSNPSYSFIYSGKKNFRVAVYVPPEVVPDTQPPSTTVHVSGTQGSNGWYISDVTVELIAIDDLSGVKAINYSINGEANNISGDKATISLSNDGVYTISYYAVDNAGNIEAEKSIIIGIDKTPPTVTVTATPNILWPPRKKELVNVKIDGSVTEETSGVASLIITVEDEYGTYNMAVPNFGSVIQLEAWRDGDDPDGRYYTITATVTDNAGHQSSATTEVIVPHDMGK
jgi:hypothetical protein